jgi:hypothetical protein
MLSTSDRKFSGQTERHFAIWVRPKVPVPVTKLSGRPIARRTPARKAVAIPVGEQFNLLQ